MRVTPRRIGPQLHGRLRIGLSLWRPVGLKLIRDKNNAKKTQNIDKCVREIHRSKAFCVLITTYGLERK